MAEVFRGYIEHIIYRNDTNGYTVFNITDSDTDDDIACVGICPGINEGEKVEVEGVFVEHKTYGPQLKVSKIQVIQPEDAEAIEKYLASGAIKGIGMVMAKRIVEKFGDSTFEIMEKEPERLAEIKGISLNIARRISEQFEEKKDMREAMLFLQKYGISNQLAVKIYSEYKSEIYDVVANNPYRMARDIKGVGFKIADEIGRKVGIDPESPYRKKCAIEYVLSQATSFGHIYLPENELMSMVYKLLGTGEVNIEDELEELTFTNDIVRKKVDEVTVYYSGHMYYMELTVARMLLDLNCSFKVSEQAMDKKINEVEKICGKNLADMQRVAVSEAMRNGVLVVTGGPGTGKTTTVDAIINAFEMEGMDILLAAPTGRAAKRMSETTGHPAQTIHRLLELNGGVGEDDERMKFERNESYPLETDVVIIDEMSMVDLPLINALLKAMVVGTRLVLVGDVNQLPSVGPGNVLKDIIDSGCFKVVMLNEVFRQAQDSDIVMNAHMINSGQHILLDNDSKDFFMLKRSDPNQIINVVLQLIVEKMPKYVNAGMTDIQVLSPMRKGELGVENLNVILQRYVNPPAPHKAELVFRDITFRENDKVMQIKNNYQAVWQRRGYHGVVLEEGSGVFNGDTGIIKNIDKTLNEVTVEFEDNKYVTYEYASLEELELAYAVTVHKSQGSEYPAVVIPILGGSSLLFNRNLLYTAVTRAKKCVTLVGSEEMVYYMIDNQREQKRYTTLNTRIIEMNSV